MTISPTIEKICCQLEDDVEGIELVRSIDSAAELYALLDHYNWDDGFEIPAAIADHPDCELAIAIKLYWLAAAEYWHEPAMVVEAHNRAHYEFQKRMHERILSGYYSIGAVSHSEDFGRVQIYKFKKRGLPAVFYEPFVGMNASRAKVP